MVESTSIFTMIVSTVCAAKRVTYVLRQYLEEIVKTCAKVVHVLERFSSVLVSQTVSTSFFLLFQSIHTFKILWGV